jgi:hypothetical protein
MARVIGSFDLLSREGQQLDDIRTLAERGRSQVADDEAKPYKRQDARDGNASLVAARKTGKPPSS